MGRLRLVLAPLALVFASCTCASSTVGIGDPCPAGTKRCQDKTVMVCGSSGKWEAGEVCATACSGGACTLDCTAGDKTCSGLTARVCDASGKWQETLCSFVCTGGDCTGVCAPSSKRCVNGAAQVCDATGQWPKGTDCPFGCGTDECRPSCGAGEFNCWGNQVQKCDLGPPAKWVPVTPGVTCNPLNGQRCDAKTGTCKASTPIGTTTPTGTYYEYATFNKADGGFKGGYDVDGYGDHLYVKSSPAGRIDVYKVTLHDTDGDGKLEPNQHPDNPKEPGPVEQRTLEFVKSYTGLATTAPFSSVSSAELYVLGDRLYATNGSLITEYLFANGAVTSLASTGLNHLSHLGHGDLDGRWYASSESLRRVYSYHEPSKSWVVEFDYPNLAGDHMDGLEVLVSSSGEQFVYVSDMTSNFIGQYQRTPDGWVQKNLFKYNDSAGELVEGMGFGALSHFWMTSGNLLYEVGGGDLAPFTEGGTGCPVKCASPLVCDPKTNQCVCSDCGGCGAGKSCDIPSCTCTPIIN